ncbi:DUF29 domain-containing protein [Crocosphaera watsonii WH 8501]|uniref:DUF29 domain-containing protein n=3 Tax=Crocosphaera watsonii TaxID=263511 RepID=Q4BUV2_CROWT|nr:MULTISPECIES: DUF29 domain-containing protein [Crocosphaera]EAM47678.1 Protein of unknown function DUF29 [Crocosphaera watsonii WH 8501]NQZ62074.1 DUF29 domain-containing protein [Crocosphaera sp.]CCQ53381.1 Protein of unknown function DUF29 [Crocosphaera watsonii WH 8502]CCQ63655.1 Protein of unknown function DUF29 [Crocosphaera watsonii WH 0401]
MKTNLYDKDYYLWLEETIQLLQEGRLTDLDIFNLIEEIKDMGRSEKNALESNLIVLLMHLLKWKYQPEEQSGSWRGSIREHRRRILKAFKNSPSLKRYFEVVFDESYQEARKQAADETELSLNTFPKNCPFKIEEILDPEYLP